VLREFSFSEEEIADLLTSDALRYPEIALTH
jgi:hypothetical protein